MSDRMPFSEEYKPKAETSTETLATKVPKAPIPHGAELDIKRYGIAKPKRIVIRANITHD